MVQQKNNETIHRCRRSGKHPSKNSSCLANRKFPISKFLILLQLECVSWHASLSLENMMRHIRTLSVTLGQIAIAYTTLAQQPPAPPAPTPAVLQKYQHVTAERLKNPEPGNWLMIRRTYDGWGYSPLDQITTQNVTRLRPVWGFSTGETRVHESAPIVNNGVMFVSTPNNQVIAIEAKTDDVLWR